MTRVKSKFICQDCGFETTRWLGRCPDCGSWNSLMEEVQNKTKPHQKGSIGDNELPAQLAQVASKTVARLDLGMEELNRVLGGGLVPGTVVLLAGDPGIGKSTLLLQAASYAACKFEKVLYISGEESVEQIKLRALRTGLGEGNLWVWAETELERICDLVQKEKPKLVIIDSIQTVFSTEIVSAPGTISQIKEATARFISLSKKLNIPIIIVGHVTKDGGIAGPRVLEHMVDTVLYFEGERHYQLRVLRAMKNRFGSTFEMGVFQMKNEGLAEVLNPSQAFLAERSELSPGSVVAACMEGTRPILVEIQALVCQSTFGQPRRMTTGTDPNRVNLIIAVLEKRAGLNFNYQDAYVNLVGGIKAQEPALDLAVAVALSSSLRNVPCQPGTVVIGEVGLAGEVRTVSYLEKRIQEAKKLGFNTCVIPANGEVKEKNNEVKLYKAKTLSEALAICLK